MDVAGFPNRRLYFIRPYVSMLYPLAGSFSCSVLLQPAVKGLNIFTAREDTAREQVTFYLTSSDIARGPERYVPGHFQIISVPVRFPSASTYHFI